jgi:hypothetical protein
MEYVMIPCLSRVRVHSEGREIAIMAVDCLKCEDHLDLVLSLLMRVLFLR